MAGLERSTASDATDRDGLPAVDIIIPSGGDARRAQLLPRAIHSVYNQELVRPRVIVVFNGSNVEPALLASIRSDPRIRVEHLPQAGFLDARLHGRSLVEAEFHGFLDDDDEYLPGALAARVEPLLRDSSLDFVATNGLIQEGSTSKPHLQDTAAIHADPLSALLQQNWLASCGALYRSTTVSSKFLEELPAFSEWTLFAFRLLVAGLRVQYLDVPTFRITCTPVSLTRSPIRSAQMLYTLQVVDEMARTGPPYLRRRIEELRRETLHACANLYFGEKDLRAAWSYHWSTLRCESGLKHLPFLRHLLYASVSSLWKRSTV